MPFVTSAALAQSARTFVRPEFAIPANQETREFRLCMLTVNDLVKDYDAVITRVARLKAIWPSGTWPEDLTIEQNLIDLGWRQNELSAFDHNHRPANHRRRQHRPLNGHMTS